MNVHEHGSMLSDVALQGKGVFTDTQPLRPQMTASKDISQRQYHARADAGHSTSIQASDLQGT